MIDDTYSRMSTVIKGAKSAQQFGSHTDLDLPSCNAPMAFIRPPYGRWVFVFCDRTAATPFLRLLKIQGESDFACSYKIIDPNNAAWLLESGTYGLQVFNASSAKLFDSRAEIVNIDATATFAITTDVSGFTTYTLPAPAFGQRFVSISAPVVSKLEMTSTQSYTYGVFMRLNSETSVDVGNRLYRQVSGSFAPSVLTMTSASVFLAFGFSS